MVNASFKESKPHQSPIPGSSGKLTLLVVGAGTMGMGIAQVAAAAGECVGLFDRVVDAPQRAIGRMANSLQRAKARGLIDQEAADRVLRSVIPVESLTDAGDVPIVIEAIKEDQAQKQNLFIELEAVIPPQSLLLTNTSMISITSLASVLRHPQRFAGTHFFNPVPRMHLVELIAGEATSGETTRAVRCKIESWGKTIVEAPDSPGFIVNRIFDALKREALGLLEEGVKPQDVDTALKLGLNFPMGPFELMDLIGLDTTFDCLCNQARQTGRPTDFGKTLPTLVASGKLGRKSGTGFYEYHDDRH